MALSKLASALCAVALVAVSPAQETVFVASATTTHFKALNPNSFTVLMVLGDLAHGARAQMLVAPGAEFETSFPSGTLDQIYIEVVFYSPAGRYSSGAVSFDSVMQWQASSLEVELTNAESESWICTATGRVPAESSVSLVPACLMNSTANTTEPLLIAPTEVPVLTPTDIHTNNIAPKVQGTDPTV